MATAGVVRAGLTNATAADGDAATISGTVFRDFNQNGSRDAREPGISGVSVTAVCDQDTDANPATAPVQETFGPVTSAASVDTMRQAGSTHGTYSIPVKQGKCRVEFVAPTAAKFLFPAQHGTNNGSTVQFVTVSTAAVGSVDASFANPSDYCVPSGATADFAITQFCNGDPLVGGSTAANFRSLALFNSATTSPWVTTDGSKISSASNTGSVYGVAYSAKRQKVYSAAYLYRHMGLGPGGLDAIYEATPAVNAGASLWLDTGINNGSIGTNGSRGLTSSGGQSWDLEAFAKSAVVGFGDMDINDDESMLYVTNLYDRMIYPITIDTKAVGAPITVPDPGCADGAAARPFALEFYDGKLYAGTTCTGETFGMANPTSTTNNMLSASVYAYDPATSSWSSSLINVPLNFTRGLAQRQMTASNKFYPWIDVNTRVSTWTTRSISPLVFPVSTAYFNTGINPYVIARPMPLLTDLEFDWDGSMILTVGDRAGQMFGEGNHSPQSGVNGQMATANGGDLLRAAPPAAGSSTYRLESNGSLANGLTSTVVPANTTGSGPGGPNSNQGPGGGEFYGADNKVDAHSEISAYASEYIQGWPELAKATMDPVEWTSGGVSWFDNSTGKVSHGITLYQKRDNNIALGKQMGIGDLEALCGQSPLEIGNRAWFDADKDGVQDPSEVPIAGITVKLVNSAGATVATTTTDAKGQYYFAATPNTDYQIVFDPSTVTNFTGMTGVTSASQLAPTTVDAGSSNTVDSDMVAATKTITYTTTNAGEDNHTLDAGFSALAIEYDLALRKTVNGTATQFPLSAGDTVTFNIEVFNQSTAVARIAVTDYIDTAVWESFDPALNPSGTTTGDHAVAYSWDATSTAKPVVSADVPLATGESVVIPITLRIKAGYTGADGDLLNWAEVSNFDDNTNSADGDAASGAISDVDSTPDGTNHTTDGEDLAADMIDNEITESGIAAGDEDDHDLARVDLLDLALRKTVKTVPSPLEAGGKVTFNIEVFNQGTTYANGIEVTDYLDPAFWETFAAADNAAGNTTGDHTYPYTWAPGTGGATATITGSLAPGESVIVPVTLTVKAGVTGQLDNLAEISKETAVTSTGTPIVDVHGDPLTDSDSTPDTTNSDELVDDELNNAGGDEDDHDIASVTATPPPTTTTTTTTTTAPTTTTTTTTEPPTTTTTTTEPPTTTTTTAPTTTTTTAPPTTTTTEPPTTTTTTAPTTTTTAPTTTTTTAPPTTTTTEPPTTTTTTAPTTTTTAPPAVFDLALRKVLAAGQASTVQLGDNVTFTITVFNQGDVDGTAIEVTDYVPVGLTLDDTDWTLSADGLTATLNNTLDIAAGANAPVDITFAVNALGGSGPKVNWAEISDASGPGGSTVTDVDSTPNGSNFSEPGETNDPALDNVIDQNGKSGGDEDDHDPASITIAAPDLWITKVTDTSLSTGTTAVWTVEVGNNTNATVAAAAPITVTDTLPNGVTFVSAVGSGWVCDPPAGQVFVCTLDQSLAPGATAPPIQVTGTVTVYDTVLVNKAHVAPATGEVSVTDNDDDDSITVPSPPTTTTAPPTTTTTTAPPTTTTTAPPTTTTTAPPTTTTTTTTAPPATTTTTVPPSVSEFDLALRKVLADGQASTVNVGDKATFTITVTNQGSIDATDVAVIDYIPAGLALADSDWDSSADGRSAVFGTSFDLAVGDSMDIDITFTVTQGAVGSLVNWAEISDAAGPSGGTVTDIDSTPNGDNHSEAGEIGDEVIDDEVDGDGKDGGDEDDHDLASLTVTPPVTTTTAPPGTFDLALRKVLASGQATVVRAGDSITFTISVINQGSIDARSIAIADYIPSGLEVADDDWTVSTDGTSAVYNDRIDLKAGETADVDITFTIGSSAASGEKVNWAEISEASGPDGTPIADVDSTPNGDNHSEPGENSDAVLDDNVDGNGKSGGDEDDHDLAPFTVESNVVDATTTSPVSVKAASTVPASLGFVDSVVSSVPAAVTGGTVLPLLIVGAGLVLIGVLLRRRTKGG